jgi:hypothetical protein
MADKKISVNDMIAQVTEWHQEAMNFRNDGWTQQGYRDNILHMHARLRDIVDIIDISNNRPAAPPDDGIQATVPDDRAYRADPRNVYVEEEGNND